MSEGRSFLLGFDRKVGTETAESYLRGEGAAIGPAAVRDDARAWLTRYEKRLERAGGDLRVPRGERVAGQPAVELRAAPAAPARRVPLGRVMDGRTVAGLNRVASRLVAVGVPKAKAVGLALNGLADWRNSAASTPTTQRKKTEARRAASSSPPRVQAKPRPSPPKPKPSKPRKRTS